MIMSNRRMTMEMDNNKTNNDMETNDDIPNAPTMMDRYGCKNSLFAKNTDAYGSGMLLSSYRFEHIPFDNFLISCTERRDNVIENLKKAISKASDDIDISNLDDDALYLHAFVMNGGYIDAILTLSKKILDSDTIEFSKIYRYEGSDGLLFPLLFMCAHAIELSAKAFIYIHNKNYKKNHSIRDLFDKCINICINKEMKDILMSYKPFVYELSDMTSDGFAMRYPVDTHDNKYLKLAYIIDVESLKDTVLDLLFVMSRIYYGHSKFF